MERRIRRLEALEGGGAALETEAERRERLEMVRDGAERENEGFFRQLATERRTAFLEDVGYEGHGPGALRDENFLYPGDVPPFVVDEEGNVSSSRDGKPVTEYTQTMCEVWYFQALGWGAPGLVHDEEGQAFYTPGGDLALSRDHMDLRHLMGDARWEHLR
ncbi:MAG: hypothetical protein M3R38_38785 [Actinomycetota bacterium]|nr:hypothetical protein [Actinomycetota bacterium]